jgi:hypothetical protein
MFHIMYPHLSIEHLNKNFGSAVSCSEFFKLGTLLSMFKTQFRLVGSIKNNR